MPNSIDFIYRLNSDLDHLPFLGINYFFIKIFDLLHLNLVALKVQGLPNIEESTQHLQMNYFTLSKQSKDIQFPLQISINGLIYNHHFTLKNSFTVCKVTLDTTLTVGTSNFNGFYTLLSCSG